jgi:hypothetical protein
MEPGERRAEGSVAWRRKRPRRPPLDCRECGAVCERLVSPWRCLRAGCPCVYSYQDEETTYFGCLHKVFAPELDLAAFLDEAGQVNRWSDPYGPIRATREPRVHCPVTVERAYEGASAGQCRNPGFLHGYSPERRRDRPLDAEPGAGRDHDLSS